MSLFDPKNTLAGYADRGGDSQWKYPTTKRSLLDTLLAAIMGIELPPTEPLKLYNIDEPMPLGESRFTPVTLNYNRMREYNPYVAEQYANGKIDQWMAQQIINNGNVDPSLRLREWGPIPR